MPALDRRVVVRRTTTTTNFFGEPESTVTDVPMWATRVDASLIDAATEGGDLNSATRTYVVRWRRDLVEALASDLSVIEGEQTLSVDNIIEQGDERAQRRRFLRLECIGEATS